MSSVQVKVEVNRFQFKRRLDSLINDDTTMLEINNTLARMCDPYVPFLSGTLAQSIEVTPQCVRYVQPYARRQYYGVDFNFTKDQHPLATAMWDEAMMRDHGEEFTREVEAILARRARELYG